jgi:hypothetical protein
VEIRDKSQIDVNTYQMDPSVIEMRTMAEKQDQKKEFPDEEIEEILYRNNSKDQITVAEVREVIRENPLLIAGLVFTFGLLLGASLGSGRRK